MNTKYVYVFRNINNPGALTYFIPLRMECVDIPYLLKMLMYSHSGLRRFQIGVQTNKNGVKNLIWYPTIFKVCDDINKTENNFNNDFLLDKNFMPLQNKQFLPIVKKPQKSR